MAEIVGDTKKEIISLPGTVKPLDYGSAIANEKAVQPVVDNQETTECQTVPPTGTQRAQPPTTPRNPLPRSPPNN